MLCTLRNALILIGTVVLVLVLGSSAALAKGGTDNAACTKIEDGEIGSATSVIVDETRVQISWDAKPDELNEFIGFAWNADSAVSVTVKAGPERYNAGEGTSGAWTSPPTGKNGTQKAISYIKFCGEEPPVEEPPSEEQPDEPPPPVEPPVEEPSEEPSKEPPVEEPPVDEPSEEPPSEEPSDEPLPPVEPPDEPLPPEEPLDELPILPVTGPTYDIFGFAVDLYAIAGFGASLILMGSALLIVGDEAKRAKFTLVVRRARRIGSQLRRPRGPAYVFAMPRALQRMPRSRPWHGPREVVSQRACMLNGAWRFG